MGFGTRLGNWLAEKAQKKKIKVLQKVIDKLNKALEDVTQDENEYLEDAARELQLAREYGGRYESRHLYRKEVAERMANDCANWRRPLLAELDLFERLKKKEIEALRAGNFTTQWTRQICFLC